MTKTSSRRVRVQALRRIAAAAVLTAAASPAVMAAAWQECDGNKIKWNSGRSNMYISTTSFPAGSSWDADLQNAMSHWNHVGGSFFNYYVGRDTDGSHSDDNGINEIYLGSGAGSMLAVTLIRTHCYWTFGYHYGIDETDIVFSNTVAWSTGAFNYANLGSPYNFELVALHELGHALGLDHEDSVLATMNSWYADGGPLGRSKEVDPLPNDRVGVRLLYGDGTAETDVAGSVMKRTGTGTAGLVTTAVWTQRGATISVEFTFANLGTAAASFDIGFYLSTNDNISTSDRWLGSNYGASAGPGGLGTYSRTLTIPPDVTPGTYTIGFLIDPNNALGEGNEANNNQPMPHTIIIN